jgi:Zn-dependent protease
MPLDLSAPAVPQSVRCDECGSDVAASLLVCPGCHRLVHSSQLNRLKADAEAAAAARDSAAELAAWRSAAALLPGGSRQAIAVGEKIDALTRAGGASSRAPEEMPKTGIWKWIGGLGPIGVLIWKLKFLVIALATKGKLLVLGLTKASTFFSMLLAFGVYWTAWGMWFAAGLVISIYIHEMGHVAALRRYGIPASAPMFIPGVGAIVRLRAQRLAPHEDARIGLAGPMWGLGAAGAAFAAARLGGGPMYAAIAHTGAWLNLFNLLPVWQLDGNRGFAALAGMQRWIIVLMFAAGWMITRDGLFVLLIAAAAFRAFDRHAPIAGDRGALAQFGFLIAALSIIVTGSRVQP